MAVMRGFILAVVVAAASATRMQLRKQHIEVIPGGTRVHTAAFVQEHKGVLDSVPQPAQAGQILPAAAVDVQSNEGIIDNAGTYQDEVSGLGVASTQAAAADAPVGSPQAVGRNGAALVAAQAGVSRRPQTQAASTDDSDGGDASDLIDGPNAPAEQEAVTREDIQQAQEQEEQQAAEQEVQNQQQAAAMTEMQAQVTPAQPMAAEVQPARPVASLAATGAMVTQGSQAQASTAAGAGQPTGVTRPKGWDQCLKFARYVKSQDVTGVELVRVWKSTCEPAVQSGSATERYRLMCNSLGGAVEPYAAQLDYNVEQLCDSVLAVFHDVTAVDTKAR